MSRISVSTLLETISNKPLGLHQCWRDLLDSQSDTLNELEVMLCEDDPNLPRIATSTVRLPQGDPRSVVVIPQKGAVMSFSDPRLTRVLVVRPSRGRGAVSISRQLLYGLARQLEQILVD
jgi:hypothetical protein